MKGYSPENIDDVIISLRVFLPSGLNFDDYFMYGGNKWDFCHQILPHKMNMMSRF